MDHEQKVHMGGVAESRTTLGKKACLQSRTVGFRPNTTGKRGIGRFQGMNLCWRRESQAVGFREEWGRKSLPFQPGPRALLCVCPFQF